MQSPDSASAGFYQAARVLAARLAERDPEPKDAFLRRHEALREWLEPMLADGEPEAETTPESTVPRLGPYRLLRELGRGGMGVVHEARREGETTSVALKVLPEHLALREDSAARFAREAELAQRLDHPGIVRIRDTGVVDGTRFLVMDFIIGAPLDRVLAALHGREPAGLTGADLAAAVRGATILPSGATAQTGDSDTEAFASGYVASVVRIAIQVAHALAHAHTAGVLHRDVKPSNLLVARDGTVVLTDFGLARDAQASTLTLTGDFAGTPHYVSPEQAMAKRVPVDQRTDLFSLGSTLYELLTLHKAFDGETSQEVLGRILSKEPVSPVRFHAGLPEDLVTILQKLLEKDPDRRYHDGTQLASDLRAFLEYRPVAARRASTIHRVVRWTRREPAKAALVAVLALAGPALTAAAGYLWARRDEIRAGREQLLTERIDQLVDQGFLGYMLESPEVGVPDFEQALALSPACTEAGIGLVLAVLRRDGPEAALARLQGSLAAEFPAPPRDLLHVVLLQRLGRDADARALERRLGEPRTSYELLLQGLQSRDRGLNSGTQLLEYTERAVLAADRPRLWLHLHWAVFADQAQDSSSCRRCAANLLLNWPRLPLARYFACLALRRVQPERAEELVRESLAEQPEVGILHCALGMVLRARQDLPGAIAAFERAVAIAPATPNFRYNLGHAYHDAGETHKAVEQFRAALAVAPRMTDAWVALGMALRKLGELGDAREALRKATALNPRHPDARFQLGQLLMQLGKPQDSLVELREAAHQFPRDPNRWHHMASAQLANHDPTAALASLERAVEADPTYERAHEVLVLYLREQNDPAALRAALRRWTEALPQSAKAWTWSGWQRAAEDDGDPLDAVHAVWAAQRALALTRDQSAEAWLLLAEGLRALGQSDAARTALERSARAGTADLTDAHRALLGRRRRELRSASQPSATRAADR